MWTEITERTAHKRSEKGMERRQHEGGKTE